MLNKKNIVFAASFLLATTLTITIIKASTAEESASNGALTQQVQTQLAADAGAAEDTSVYIAGIKDDAVKEDEVKIITYTVKSGDTLSGIGNTYNVKVSTIAGSNNISPDTLLKEGLVLEFPSVNGVLYKIQEGETLWDLALLNDVDINKIIEINKLESPEKLKLGQRIILPDVARVKSAVSNANSNKSTAVSSKVAASSKTLSRGSSSRIIGSLPVRGKITSLFGPRWGRQHAGIDIAAPTGTKVLASMDGRVSFSGWSGGYGYLVIIDHGNGLQTYYGHNSKLRVTEGQSVRKGAHIADVGSTGNSTGPHSHFEVRKNGSPVNPYTYVR